MFALRNDIFKVGEQLLLKVHVDKMLNGHNIYTQKNKVTHWEFMFLNCKEKEC